MLNRSGRDDGYAKWWRDQNETRTNEIVRFDGLEVYVDRHVFSPSSRLTYSTSSVIQHMPDLRGKTVLDVGTGCGVLAVIAAERGACSVVATDVDERAVRNAEQNVRLHRMQNVIRVVESDLFDRVSGVFDVVIANLPIDPEAWDHLGERSDRTASRFLSGLRRVLDPNGVALLPWASFGAHENLERALDGSDFFWSRTNTDTFGATWHLYKLRRSPVTTAAAE